MNEPAETVDPLTIQRERDLYLRLLRLGGQTDVGSLLVEALGLVVQLTSAQRGYIELNFERDASRDGASWSVAQGFTDAEVE